MKKLTVFYLLLTSIVSLGQSEARIYQSKGEIALHAKDTVTALMWFKKAVKFEQFVPYSRLLALPLLSERGEFDVAVGYAEDMILMGYSFELIQNEDIDALKQSKQWGELRKCEELLQEQFENSTDSYWQHVLDSLEEVDQGVRSGDYSVIPDLHELSHIDNLMKYADSLNFRCLIDNVKKRGYPTSEKVGYLHANIVSLLLWHQRGVAFEESELWMEFLPLMKAQIPETGQEQDVFAMIQDFYAVHNNLPMLYGSLFRYYKNSDEFNKLKMLPIEEVDRNRTEIGMAPLAMFLTVNHIELPESL